MAITTQALLRIQAVLAKDTAFSKRLFEENFSLDHSAEEIHTEYFEVTGQVTDQAISFGNVNSPTAILLKFTSTDPDTSDNPLNVTVKIDSAASGSVQGFLLLGVQDPANDTLTTDITFSTEDGASSGSLTEVTVVVIGRKT